jgi:four helix bundle protein
MQNFRNLKVWSKSHKFTLDVYQLTRPFPLDERFGLTNQIRRACASIGANLAEGCGRKSDADMARFVQIAMGSASEAEYHLLLAHDLHFLAAADYKRLNGEVTEIKRMLSALLSTLRANA